MTIYDPFYKMKIHINVVPQLLHTFITAGFEETQCVFGTNILKHQLHVIGLVFWIVSKMVIFSLSLLDSELDMLCAETTNQRSVYWTPSACSYYYPLMFYSKRHAKTSADHCHNLFPSSAGVVTHHVPFPSASSA